LIKRTKIEVSEENRILSHLIANTQFLKDLSRVAKPKLFKTTMAQTVSQWVLEYYEHFSEAPGKNIQEIYLKKRKEVRDEDDTELIASFLTNLSKNWEQTDITNIPFTVKQAVNYFKLRNIECLKSNLEEAITQDDPALAERIIADFAKVDRVEGDDVDLFRDAHAVSAAFNNKDEFLFRLPGALGEVIGDFVRGDFVGFLAPPKRGKSWWLWYIGYRAAMVGLKVAFFSLEMTKERNTRRQWQSMQGLPIKAGRVEIPYFKEADGGKWSISSESVKKPALSTNVAYIQEQQKKYRMATRTGQIKTKIHPMDSATISDLENDLENWHFYENFIPDVIIVDYADIIKPETSNDYRHNLDGIWKKLRGWAQSYNACVVTASQTDRKANEGEVKKTSAAEDIRKLGHVTKLLTKQQDKNELAKGYCRLESLVQREGKHYSGSAYVLECLDIARPYIDSRLDIEIVDSFKKFHKTGT